MLVLKCTMLFPRVMPIFIPTLELLGGCFFQCRKIIFKVLNWRNVFKSYYQLKSAVVCVQMHQAIKSIQFLPHDAHSLTRRSLCTCGCVYWSNPTVSLMSPEGISKVFSLSKTSILMECLNFDMTCFFKKITFGHFKFIFQQFKKWDHCGSIIAFAYVDRTFMN